MHRRTLPIADPCHAFRPEPGKSFCDKCEKHVHDLSAMTRREAERFLGAHVGERICVAYRTTRDGSILVRPEPRMIGVVLMALGLAACTGYAPEMQHPDESCHDEHGYQIDCGMVGRSDEPAMPEVEPVPVAPVADLVEAPVEAPAIPEAEELTRVGLVRVDPAPEATGDPAVTEMDIDHEMGAVMVDEETIQSLAKDDRRSRREARRDARRERWASRHSGK